MTKMYIHILHVKLFRNYYMYFNINKYCNSITDSLSLVYISCRYSKKRLILKGQRK